MFISFFGLAVPIATLMRRLLTGYAVTYNHRHRRHGHLFQNRYKSIPCQEDSYLLELVRYIHLNPLRGKLVNDIGGLEVYPYAGHRVILGKGENPGQDAGYVLAYFDRRISWARRKYRKYVEEGIGAGRRRDLTGGGLMRSMGGWVGVVKGLEETRVKGNERILGDSDFVEEALKAAEEELRRRYRLRVEGYDLQMLAGKVARDLGLEAEDLLRPGKYGGVVEGRDLVCYWAVRELGWSVTDIAKRIGISQPAVSYAVRRGERAVRKRGLRISPK
jgi:putative transposase